MLKYLLRDHQSTQVPINFKIHEAFTVILSQVMESEGCKWDNGIVENKIKKPFQKAIPKNKKLFIVFHLVHPCPI